MALGHWLKNYLGSGCAGAGSASGPLIVRVDPETLEILTTFREIATATNAGRTAVIFAPAVDPETGADITLVYYLARVIQDDYDEVYRTSWIYSKLDGQGIGEIYADADSEDGPMHFN